MTTATKDFTHAIHVRRTSDRIYEFASTADAHFVSVINPYGRQYDWSVVEPLTGWGDWTHAVKVMHGDQDTYYFVR